MVNKIHDNYMREGFSHLNEVIVYFKLDVSLKLFIEAHFLKAVTRYSVLSSFQFLIFRADFGLDIVKRKPVSIDITCIQVYIYLVEL